MKIDIEGTCLILVIGALLYVNCQGKWAVYGECIRRDGITACKDLRP
jgi:hypothetical protein